ncbi:hypothetical protein GH140_02060 [bacterium]|nr:hypothetical protein [bacterium]
MEVGIAPQKFTKRLKAEHSSGFYRSSCCFVEQGKSLRGETADATSQN